MKILEVIKSPQSNYSPIYNGGYSSENIFEIEVKGEKISFLAVDVIEGNYPPSSIITSDDKKLLNQCFNIGYVNRSHDGGGVVYIQKNATNKKYIFYFGINEVSNSHYLIYHHGIVEVEV